MAPDKRFTSQLRDQRECAIVSMATQQIHISFLLLGQNELYILDFPNIDLSRQNSLNVKC